MELTSINEIQKDPSGNPFAQGSVFTIGNFDGLHLGHQELLKRVKVESEARALPSVAMSFWPHPKEVLASKKEFLRLFSREQKIRQFEKVGVDYLFLEEFTVEFSRLSAKEFIEGLILKWIKPQAIVVGYDFRFGQGGEGDVNYLQNVASHHSIDFFQVEAFKFNNEVVSSSRIRSLLSEGNVEEASQLMGRNYSLSGVVEPGEKRGREIGFPTLNLAFRKNLVPLSGVYITQVNIQGKVFNAVTNVGTRPTFYSQGDVVIESHLLDGEGDFYGKEIEVRFIKRLRPEKKFASLELLVQQIQVDVSSAKEYFIKHEMGRSRQK